MADTKKIPNKIHYCWFGKSKMPPLIEECIESWRRFFPEYEIIEWNESNFEVTETAYMKEAYECGKWAFVSDYARLKIIYEYGGIYFDTDVEVLKNFEPLLKKGGYMSYENTTGERMRKYVNTGLGFAAFPRDEVVYKMMQEYDNRHFVIDGEMDLTPCPVRNTRALEKLGLVPNGSLQVVKDITIYPFEYFCGYDMYNTHPYVTSNTYTIHHYSGSWKNEFRGWNWFKYKVLILGLQKILGYERYKILKRKLKGEDNE